MIRLQAAFDEFALRLWMLSVKHGQYRSFLRSLDSPQQTQKATLAAIVKRNRSTEFGKAYDLQTVDCDLEFRSRIPIHTYEDIRPSIEKQIESNTTELNPVSPSLYMKTSGTTGIPKYIPLCEDSLVSYRRTQNLSTYIQYNSVPGIFRGKLLTLVSPMVEGRLPNGTPYGSMSGVVRHSLPDIILSRSLLPEEALQSLNYEDRYRLVAAIAVCAPDVSCLASANPSTLIRLSEIINANFNSILSLASTGSFDALGVSLPEPHRATVKALCTPSASRLAVLQHLAGSRVRFSDLWPQLCGVVTWTSGNCSLLIPKLTQQLSPAVRIIDMGYLASEFWGTITVDLQTNFGVPTLADNFFEFIEPEVWESGGCETLLLHELQVGQQYYLIITTPNGLYRYFINDLIEVTGRYRKTPTLRFSQKGKGVTNLTGEKLYEGQIIQAVQATAMRLGIEFDSFIMLADRKNMSYTLYIESEVAPDLVRFTTLFDDALGEVNVEYTAKLKSGRLPIPAVKYVPIGTFAAFRRAAISAGQREEQFKTVKLQYADEIAFPFEEHVCLPK